MGIPEDPANDPFAGFDQPEARLQTALERKQTYRRFLEGGATLRLILSAGKRFLIEKGYSRGAALARLEALAAFVDGQARNDKSIVGIRRAPMGELSSTSYNDEVSIQSSRVWVEDDLPYRSASWHLWRDHRVFVPFATVQNWVEAGGKKGR